MLKNRIIPVLLLRNGVLVQSRLFKRYQIIGSPTAAVKRLSSWNSDELIYIDISTSTDYDLGRDDLNHPGYNTIDEIIQLTAEQCHMPLTFGGRIRNMSDVARRLHLGADKITVNTLCMDHPEFINECSREFGRQVVVASIDAKITESGKFIVVKGGKQPTKKCPFELAREMEDRGAGEILINSVDLDGTGQGFDIELISRMVQSVNLPVIGLGGAGSWQDFETALNCNLSAVAAANIFHHSENSVYELKKHLWQNNFNVRKPTELTNISQLL